MLCKLCIDWSCHLVFRPSLSTYGIRYRQPIISKESSLYRLQYASCQQSCRGLSKSPQLNGNLTETIIMWTCQCPQFLCSCINCLQLRACGADGIASIQWSRLFMCFNHMHACCSLACSTDANVQLKTLLCQCKGSLVFA